MFFQKNNKKVCLFYILILLLWGTVSSTTSISELTDTVCDLQDCYVNHSSAITPLGNTFPSQEYLSARNLGAQETVSVVRGRSIRPLTRSVRNLAAILCSGTLLSGIAVFSRHFSGQEILSHCLCGIVITNYIHDQDGHKI